MQKIMFLCVGLLILTGCGALAPEAPKEETLTSQQMEQVLKEEQAAVENAPTFTFTVKEFEENLSKVEDIEFDDYGFTSKNGKVEVHYTSPEGKKSDLLGTIYLEIDAYSEDYEKVANEVDQVMNLLLHALNEEYDAEGLKHALENPQSLTLGEIATYDSLTFVITNNDKPNRIQIMIAPN